MTKYNSQGKKKSSEFTVLFWMTEERMTQLKNKNKLSKMNVNQYSTEKENV